MQEELKAKPAHEYIDLAGAILPRTNLSHADLTGANLERANLTGVDCSYAIFAHAKMREIILQGADLRHADLSHADLYGANLSVAVMEGSSLFDANLEMVRFTGTDLRGMDFSTVKGLSWNSLLGGIFDETTRFPEYLEAAILTKYLQEVFPSVGWPTFDENDVYQVADFLGRLAVESNKNGGIEGILTRLEIAVRETNRPRA